MMQIFPIIMTLLMAWPVFGKPLDFVKPPIVLKQVGLGICNGDRDYRFIDHGGEEFYITITYPPPTLDSLKQEREGKLDKRPATISVVHRDAKTATVDGDDTQQRVLQLASDLAEEMRAKLKRDGGNDTLLRNLDILIRDLQSRLPQNIHK